MVYRLPKKDILIRVVFVLLLCFSIPTATWAADVRISVSDPEKTQGQSHSGNTVNTVLDTPTVTIGENRVLGTLRIAGKEGIDIPLHPGNKVMVTLPAGFCYSQVPSAENYGDYVQWPEMVDGVKNQIRDAGGKPGIKFIAGTPRSIVIEVGNVAGPGQIFIDFVYNKKNASAVRVAKLFDYKDQYLQKPDEKVTRLEYITMFADVYLPFPSKHVEKMITNQEPLRQEFKDIDKAENELEMIKPLFDTGIIVGQENGVLKPNEYISRAEGIALISKVLPPLAGDSTVQENIVQEAIPSWAQESIQKAITKKIVVGYPDGTIKPDQLLTRAEAISILERYFES